MKNGVGRIFPLCGFCANSVCGYCPEKTKNLNRPICSHLALTTTTYSGVEVVVAVAVGAPENEHAKWVVASRFETTVQRKNPPERKNERTVFNLNNLHLTAKRSRPRVRRHTSKPLPWSSRSDWYLNRRSNRRFHHLLLKVLTTL